MTELLVQDEAVLAAAESNTKGTVMRNYDMIVFVMTYTQEIREAIYRERNDPNIPKVGGGGHCRISDPTAMKAIRNACELEVVDVYYGPIVNGKQQKKKVKYPEAWVDVANSVREQYGDSLQGTIIQRYFQPVRDTRKEICKDLRIGTTYYNMMLKEIFCFAYGYAKGKGVIFPKIVK